IFSEIKPKRNICKPCTSLFHKRPALPRSIPGFQINRKICLYKILFLISRSQPKHTTMPKQPTREAVYRRLVRCRKADTTLSKYGFTNPSATPCDGKHVG